MKNRTTVLLIFTVLLFSLTARAAQDTVPYDELTVKPTIVKRVPPKYPEEARKNHQTGLTVIKIMVGKSGKVISTQVEKSSGFDSLDEAALETAKQWEFTPGKKGDKTVKVEMKIPFNFKLKE